MRHLPRPIRAVTDLEALDISVLGRDITGLFAVIVDRPAMLCLCWRKGIGTR